MDAQAVGRALSQAGSSTDACMDEKWSMPLLRAVLGPMAIRRCYSIASGNASGL